MKRWSARVALVALALIRLQNGWSQAPETAAANSTPTEYRRSSDLPVLPSAPTGTSTVFGGAIEKIDPVRDVLTLAVPGQRPMKIFYDERTQVFRDGLRIRLRDLGPASYASVETALDKTSVFAVSIHILSNAPEGDYQGTVRNYDGASGELEIGPSPGHEPFRVYIRDNTAFAREGQRPFSSQPSGPLDLVRGALVSVRFQFDAEGRGIADRVAVLAVPGSSFAFSGNVTALDLHSGTLVLMDPRDQKEYQIYASSSHTAIIQKLHVGDRVRVVAAYDGAHFSASEISIDKAKSD